MAAAPIARKMRADIAAAGGLEPAVFDRLRDGESLAAIGRTYGVGRSLLWRYLKKEPARYAKYEQAVKDGAAGMVDKGQELLEDAATYAKTAANSAHVQAVRNQAQYLQWQAGVTDRKSFGSPDKEAQVTISIEHLHLASLQASGAPISPDIPRLASPSDTPTQMNLDRMTPVTLPLPSENEDAAGEDESLHLHHGRSRAEPEA